MRSGYFNNDQSNLPGAVQISVGSQTGNTSLQAINSDYVFLWHAIELRLIPEHAVGLLQTYI